MPLWTDAWPHFLIITIRWSPLVVASNTGKWNVCVWGGGLTRTTSQGHLVSWFLSLPGLVIVTDRCTLRLSEEKNASAVSYTVTVRQTEAEMLHRGSVDSILLYKLLNGLCVRCCGLGCPTAVDFLFIFSYSADCCTDRQICKIIHSVLTVLLYIVQDQKDDNDF